jgi:tetratricopeptide (TPR) repeat protein
VTSLRCAAALALLSASLLAIAADTDYSATLDRLWDFDDPAVSEQRFRAERARHAPDSPEALEAATQVARSLGLQRGHAQADAVLDEVAARLTARTPARVHVRYLLERGRARNSAGEPARAVPLFHVALAASARDVAPGAAFYRIDALHMLGIAATGDEALEWNRKALAAAEAATEPRARGWQASLLNNLGWTMHERGEHARALDHWQRALAAREAAGAVSRIRIAKWTVARGLRALGRLDEAEAMQRALVAELERAGAPDGYVYEELAEIAVARNDAAGAKPWAAKAYALLKDDAGLKTGEAARLARLARIGGIAP